MHLASSQGSANEMGGPIRFTTSANPRGWFKGPISHKWFIFVWCSLSFQDLDSTSPRNHRHTPDGTPVVAMVGLQNQRLVQSEVGFATTDDFVEWLMEVSLQQFNKIQISISAWTSWSRLNSIRIGRPVLLRPTNRSSSVLMSSPGSVQSILLERRRSWCICCDTSSQATKLHRKSLWLHSFLYISIIRGKHIAPLHTPKIHCHEESVKMPWADSPTASAVMLQSWRGRQ